MAEATPLKNYFGIELAELLGKKVKEVYPRFEYKKFIKFVESDIEPLELNARVELIAEGLRKFLPASYPEAVEILLSILGPPLETEEGMFTKGYMWYPLGMFVKKFGQDDLNASMKAVYEITQRNTAEFAVRPLIEKYPGKVLKTFHKWAKDKSFHVRRLTSEGLRPRLPWAGRLDVFREDPSPVLDILEILKRDESEFVRKSVANNMNDILKDHREAALDTLERWKKDRNSNTDKIIKHALRNLVKEGDSRALKMMGYDEKANVKVSKLKVSPGKVKIGKSLELSFTLENTDKKPHNLMVDYIVHFVRKGGKRNAKVFKIGAKELKKNGREEIKKSHSFKKVTTRSYYPGKHRIEIQVNGKVLAGKEFEVE